MKYILAVIIPATQADAEERAGCVRTWSQVTELLKPTLGRLCCRFYPAVPQQAAGLTDSLGITFGRKEPEKFLGLYRSAKTVETEG